MLGQNQLLIRQIYQGLLNRDPDEEGLSYYASRLDQGEEIQSILQSIHQSTECLAWQAKLLGVSPLFVFLHICRTGGTSFQEMLMDAFPNEVFAEHSDTLDSKTSLELREFSIFAGHYNHDSLRYLPTLCPYVITFVRDPVSRLVSQYNFWKAHLPTAPSWHSGMVLANKLPMKHFFNHEEIINSTDQWNHMTWSVMGNTLWSEWKTFFQLTKNANSKKIFLEKIVRPAIQLRLTEFKFVGLTEKYEESCTRLCKLMNWPNFHEIKNNHGVEKLSFEHPDFNKQHISDFPCIEAKNAMNDLVDFDLILYEEARNIFLQGTI
jgi:hypothetical protein